MFELSPSSDNTALPPTFIAEAPSPLTLLFVSVASLNIFTVPAVASTIGASAVTFAPLPSTVIFWNANPEPGSVTSNIAPVFGEWSDFVGLRVIFFFPVEGVGSDAT